MEISIKRNHGYYLVFKADNVLVEEDIESRTYSKDKDGKTNYLIPPKRDITNESMDQISSLLSDMAYFRDADFDSSSLIEQLFERLPQAVAISLATKLRSQYEEISE